MDFAMQMRRLLSLALLAGCAGALAACSDDADPDQGRDFDPVVMRALNDKLMVDPDLANQNEGNAALTPIGDHSLPPINKSDAAIRNAQEKAIRILDGKSNNLKELPEPKAMEPLAVGAKLTAEALASAMGKGACAQKLTYSHAWAARLPEVFSIYPRGNTKEAAGADRNGCKLIVVTFVTPVPLEDVLRFYFSRAGADGFSPDLSENDGEFQISGNKGKANLNVMGRRLQSELTEIDIIVDGY